MILIINLFFTLGSGISRNNFNDSDYEVITISKEGINNMKNNTIAIIAMTNKLLNTCDLFSVNKTSFTAK